MTKAKDAGHLAQSGVAIEALVGAGLLREYGISCDRI